MNKLKVVASKAGLTTLFVGVYFLTAYSWIMFISFLMGGH